MHSSNIMSGDLDSLIEREWLTVNKLGGFACSTVPGLNTRKYHGLLVAAMSPPVRRMVLLSRVEESVVCDGWTFPLACNEYPDTIHPRGDQSLRAFNADPFPRWAYQSDGWTIEKSLRLLTGENTVVLSYTLLGGDKTVELNLRPLLALRGIHELMYQWNGKLSAVEKSRGHHHVPASNRTPEVFFAHDGAFEAESHWYLNTIYRREQARGYSGLEDLWNPGMIRWSLKPGQTVHFVCSADPIDLPRVLAAAEKQHTDAMLPAPPGKAHDEPLDSLLRAADRFIVRIPGETEPTDVVAGSYPWAAPTPRHGLIGFTGLFLVPGKFAAAKSYLYWLTQQLSQGLLPSQLSETGGLAAYDGADISLWFIDAVHHYLRYTNDEDSIRNHLFDSILQIISCYRHGTRLGLGTDSTGLLETHQAGSATTWMNAKVSDWVVTPRSGFPVEINALWYNAVRIAAELAERLGYLDRAEEFTALAATIKSSFNSRFWNEAANCCFDVVAEQGDDASIRPNQLLAVSLSYPVLDTHRFEPVLEKVRTELLTPMGLRTLSLSDPSYQGHYTGNIVSRDRAYHQGSAFPWLLSPFVTAYLRVNGRGEGARGEARTVLQPCIDYLQSDGLGQLCELFDGDKPARPGGAIASALSTGEVLRAYAEDVLDLLPTPPTAKTIEANPAKIA